MSNHKYQSFEELKHAEIIGDNLSEEAFNRYRDAVSAPDLQCFLDHQRRQYIQAAECGFKSDADEYRWGRLFECVELAAEAVEAESMAQVAIRFANLGRAIKELETDYPEAKTLLQFHRAYLEKMASEHPLKIRNLGIAHLKYVAANVAGGLWQADTGNEIRLSEMCETVWPALVHYANECDLIELLPNDAKSIRPWLRAIAPSYAKKPGRPEKKKK